MHISNVHNLWDVTLRVCYEIHDFRLLVAIKVLKELFDCIIESNASAIIKPLLNVFC